MQRRQEEAQNALLVNELDRLVKETSTSRGLTEKFKQEYVRGAGELELVRSGLDDTMRTAYQSMREVWHSRKEVEDLRVAAYLVSIAPRRRELPLQGPLSRPAGARAADRRISDRRPPRPLPCPSDRATSRPADRRGGGLLAITGASRARQRRRAAATAAEPRERRPEDRRPPHRQPLVRPHRQLQRPRPRQRLRRAATPPTTTATAFPPRATASRRSAPPSAPAVRATLDADAQPRGPRRLLRRGLDRPRAHLRRARLGERHPPLRQQRRRGLAPRHRLRLLPQPADRDRRRRLVRPFRPAAGRRQLRRPHHPARDRPRPRPPPRPRDARRAPRGLGQPRVHRDDLPELRRRPGRPLPRRPGRLPADLHDARHRRAPAPLRRRLHHQRRRHHLLLEPRHRRDLGRRRRRHRARRQPRLPHALGRRRHRHLRPLPLRHRPRHRPPPRKVTPPSPRPSSPTSAAARTAATPAATSSTPSSTTATPAR